MDEKLYLLGNQPCGSIDLTLTRYQVGFFYNLLREYIMDNPAVFPEKDDHENWANDDQITIEGLKTYFFYKYHNLEI